MSPIPIETQREIDRILALLYSDRGDAVEHAAERASPLGAGYLVLVAREFAGLSQRRLAERIGTSQPALARIEAGHTVPQVRTLMRVAEASGFHLVVGLRRRRAPPIEPEALESFRLVGTLHSDPATGGAGFSVLREPTVFERAGWV